MTDFITFVVLALMVGIVGAGVLLMGTVVIAGIGYVLVGAYALVLEVFTKEN